ncbi:MAG: universal stress protein [Cellulomonadaceae bacterium]|jgi:nucleotide-binding universal stress UspA family protein|nr:universal stress protein [Cellulomonadaceae bacterium]
MTVLVACNSSEHGKAALAAGIAEASRRSEALAVLVLNPVAEVPVELSGLLEHLPAGMDAPVVTFRTEDTEPADAILDIQDEGGISMIVLGCQKSSEQGSWVMGTTTQRVLLDASVQVLVVKATYETPAGA